MNLFYYLLSAVVLIVGGWQFVVWWNETSDKKAKYQGAADHARSTGKPMLIAGGPWGVKPYRYWLKIPAHGNGDVCLDIDRNALRDHPCGVVADIVRMPFSDKSFGSAFASHILEHLETTEDAMKALGELKRVAESVYIVSPSRHSVAAWVKSEHHLWVWQENNTIYISQRGGSNGNRKVEAFVLPEQASRNVFE